MEYVTLNNGVEMPILGFGVYQIPKEETKKCVLDAIKVGFRAIDTAQSYFNEAEVGEAIAECGIPREELFITTKVWIDNYGYENCKKSVMESLKKLRTDYIDLVLLHQPFADYYEAYRTMSNKNKEKTNINENKNNSTTDAKNTTTTDKKILVVYYSAQSPTEAVTKKIANNLDADIFEIVPKDVYTSDDLNWSNDKSRVSREHNDESLRNVELETTTVDNWDNYDTILIGYPIWWGIAAWPVNTFVKANDFSNKTVIPFCTSASSDIGNSGKLLENDAKGGKWLTGQRFSSSPSDNDIKEFTDNIK